MEKLIDKVLGTLKRGVFPLGSVATIRRGNLRGFKYRVTDNSGWAPIVGNWEPGAHLIYSKLIRDGDVVYDLGANCGLHTMYFSKLVGVNGVVYAFEPLPDNIDDLSENLALNNLTNVTVVKSAVGATKGTAKFNITSHRKQGSIRERGSAGQNSVEVSLTSLDDFSESADLPNFIKVDVEGVESDVIRGAAELIDRHQPIFAIELHSPDQDVLVGTLLSSSGYQLFGFEPSRKVLPKLRRITSPHLGWPEPFGTWGTVLALPRSKVDF